MRVLFHLVDNQYWLDIMDACLAEGLEIDTVAYQRTNSELSFESGVHVVHTEYLHRLEDLLDHYAGRISWEAPIELDSFAEGEQYYLKNSDRLMSRPLTVRKRRRIYHVLYLFWLSLLKRRGIKAVFFRFPPHQGWDLPLFFAARQLRLRTLVLSMTMVEQKLCFKEHFLDDDVLRFPAVDRDLPGVNVLQAVRDKDSRGSKRFIPRPKKVLRNLKKWFQKDFALGHVMNGRLSPMAKAKLMLESRRHAVRLYRAYTEHADSAQDNEKYILFFLHLQPEASTIPAAGAFDQQLLAVSILANALPPGWTIRVKDHPAQVQTNRAGRLWKRAVHVYRDETDYDLLTRVPGVRLVPLYADVDGLIAGSQAVATVNGSVGWEAMARHGKPALTFAPTWYHKCGSCFDVRDADQARDAITRFQPLSPEKVKGDVQVFLDEYSRHWFNGAFGGFQLGLLEAPYERVVETMAVNITRAVRYAVSNAQ